MKNKFVYIIALTLCLSVAQAQPVPADQSSEPEQVEFSPLIGYIVPAVSWTITAAIASGIFLLLEVRWNLRD